MHMDIDEQSGTSAQVGVWVLLMLEAMSKVISNRPHMLPKPKLLLLLDTGWQPGHSQLYGNRADELARDSRHTGVRSGNLCI